MFYFPLEPQTSFKIYRLYLQSPTSISMWSQPSSLFFVVLLLFWKTCNADHFLNHSDFALRASPFIVKGKDINNLRPNPGEKCVHKEQEYIA